MPLINKILIFSLLLTLSCLSASVTIGRDDIDNIAARDIYDVLSKIYTLRGYSTGIIGQPVYFKDTGRLSADIFLYIDDIYYGREISDLSFISLDRVQKIVIDDMSLECSGLTVRIYTKNLDPEIPVSEVDYKDAFFNYRDLSANIAQRITSGMTVSAFGEILDFKDHREYSDDFKYPYMKQNYGLRINFPEIFSLRSTLDINYLTENKYLLDSDSSQIRPERFRSSLMFETDRQNNIYNRFGITAVSDNHISSYNVDVYDEISAGGSSSEISGKTGIISSGLRGFSGYVKAGYSVKSFLDAGLRSFCSISDNEEIIYSTQLELKKDIGAAVLSSISGYFYQKELTDADFFENSLTAEKEFKISDTGFDIRAGIDILSQSEKKYYRGGFTAGKGIRLKLISDIIVSDCKNKNDDISNNLVSSITYSDKFFKEKLFLNLSFSHRYSEYYIAERKETLNNLSFNLRARIVNFEFYYGSDNFLKDHYSVGNTSFDLNDHYVYRTVDGFDMRTHDEIWGVKWVFYR